MHTPPQNYNAYLKSRAWREKRLEVELVPQD